MRSGEPITPPRLVAGDKVAIIAPSFTKSILPAAICETAVRAVRSLGLQVVWGSSTNLDNGRNTAPVAARLSDIAWAFGDQSVRAVWCLIGGFNANQLLDGMDWEVIARNPKVFIGHSDITVLANAIYAKTGLVTYYGPNLYSFASKEAGYTLEYCRKVLMGTEIFTLQPPPEYSEWGKGFRKEEEVRTDPSYSVIADGSAEGVAIGGNAGTFFLLQGTEYMPRFAQDTILFLEDDDLAGKFTLEEFDRRLTSVMQQPGANRFVKGLLIGGFQSGAKVDPLALAEVVGRIKGLAGKPVIANVPIGHIEPKCVLPIGGLVSVKAKGDQATIRIRL